MTEFSFWQMIVSPHMAGLAQALAVLDCKVTYVAAQPISAVRASQGWSMPDTTGIRVNLIKSTPHAVSLISGYPTDTVHLMQGVRGNGYISSVIRVLRQRHARWGAIMETIDERYGVGPIKSLVYRNKLGHIATRPDFILAIGEKMTDWLAAHGFPRERIFQFAYFLSDHPIMSQLVEVRPSPFQVGFVGRLVHLKRLDLLIDALAGLLDHEFQLVIVGSGPLEAKIRRQATEILGNERVHMLGQLTMGEARARMALLDCLVLPSDHDGWGAVVSEALTTGVPAICSDACGAVTAVLASGVGGVFPKGNVKALRALLQERLSVGRMSMTERQALAAWARCLGAEAGARYLKEIVESLYGDFGRPTPPWGK
jgi:glycosyltransferase involved in cell wall biosynthesis